MSVDVVSVDTLGRLAYDAYCEASGRRSLVSGAPLPTWAAIARPEIREAWRAAADAVRMFLLVRGDDVAGS